MILGASINEYIRGILHTPFFAFLSIALVQEVHILGFKPLLRPVTTLNLTENGLPKRWSSTRNR